MSRPPGISDTNVWMRISRYRYFFKTDRENHHGMNRVH